VSKQVDLSQVSAIVGTIAAAANEGVVIEAMNRAAELIGGRNSVFVSFIADDVSHESYRFLIGCDPTFCSLYRRLNWFTSDPAVLYAASNSEPILGGELAARRHLEQDLLDVAKEQGFASVIVIPTPSPAGVSRIGVWTVGSPIEGTFEGSFAQVRIAARVIAMEIHEWWLRRVKHELIQECELSPEDMQLLGYEKRGLKSKEIAKLLGNTTPAAIDKRFHRISSRMGVPTRKEAAKQAAECGLI
jgi:hypothetical protein